jgi:hypothetical protein
MAMISSADRDYTTSECLERLFVKMMNKDDDMDELFVDGCRLLIKLMKCYDKVPKDHIVSCLLALTGIFQLQSPSNV